MAEKSLKISRFDKIARIIYASFFAVMFFIMMLTLIVPNGMIKVFGVGYYRVDSASMDPVIAVNDYVLAERVKVKDLTEGDIILFNTKRQVGHLEMVEKIFVVHYFGYLDEEGHIYTYLEANKNLASDDETKYDKWGTEARPYYVTSADLVGRHKQTLKSGEVMSYIYNVFYSPYFYLGTGIFIAGGISTYLFLNRKNNGKKGN